MKKSLLTPTLAASLLLALTACDPHAGHPDQAGDAGPSPVSGYVSDMSRFDSFIATRPTPEQFRHVYPDVQLVMPGDITTREYRSNNSRYYAELDESGRIIGGSFQ